MDSLNSLISYALSIDDIDNLESDYQDEKELKEDLIHYLESEPESMDETQDKEALNLLVFADGITFRKSKSASMVAQHSCIVEIPPLLRAKYENIITHFLICKSSPNLEKFFNFNRNELFSVFNTKIKLPKLKKEVKINIIAIVADLIKFI